MHRCDNSICFYIWLGRGDQGYPPGEKPDKGPGEHGEESGPEGGGLPQGGGKTPLGEPLFIRAPCRGFRAPPFVGLGASGSGGKTRPQGGGGTPFGGKKPGNAEKGPPPGGLSPRGGFHTFVGGPLIKNLFRGAHTGRRAGGIS